MNTLAVANILLVDDREENLQALSAVLKSPEYNLVNVTSGEAALEVLRDRDFAVILLDVMMPGMDGLETARRVRALERSRSTPIILVTGDYPDEASIRLGYEVGAVDFLSKPFDPRVMKSKVAVFVDLFRKTEKIRAQEKLLSEASESRFRTLFEQSPLAIQLFSPQGDCVEVNSAWETLWGDAANELKGRNILRMLTKPAIREAIQNVFSGTEAELPPLQFGKKWVESYFYPVRNEKGAIREVALIIKDITDRMEVEEELRMSRDRLQKAVQSRDEFISIASHELRTPVTSLILLAEMGLLQMERPETFEEMRERFKKLVTVSGSQLERLARLVDEMLDVSRIANGKLTMENETFDLTLLVRGVAEDFSDQLSSVGSRLVIEGVEPLMVCGDRFRLEQVLTNLLTNAMKYGQGKPVHVVASKHEGCALISVRDQGIGIASENHARVFERFERAISTASGVSGLGLGLYIVRKIVEGHHGTVMLESELGKGAEFKVQLPLVE